MPNDRLSPSTSPYLRMHADDPVEWYTWGDEAFARSRETDRPIFLSSGYAACHWCHVMQRESFRDETVAAFLNERFVPVKVDRELRPDVDALYMDYVSATLGRGGWPMSVFLTPKLVPVMGGTYFPAEPVGNTPSFKEALTTVDDIWRDDRHHAEVIAQAALAFLREQSAPRTSGELSPMTIDDAAESAVRTSDAEHGGFGGKPKFPQAPLLSFLIRYARKTADPQVLYHLELAVEGMLRGGIFDQAGGGMARYAVDDAWTVPHFEKMLYDNALLLSVLAGMQRLSPSDEYAHAARATTAFLRRDLGAPGGGFFASLSADTGGVEGATYVWTRAGLAAFLSPEELALAEDALGVTEEGNWEGATVLTRPGGRAEDAEAVDRLLGRILEARDARPQPDVDDKVLASWNALAASGLIEAGAVFADADMTALGVATLETLAAATDGGDVPHDLGDPTGSARLLEDHAAMAAACLTAHETLGGEKWLELGRRVHDTAVDRFEQYDMLFMAPADVDLPVRPREQGDAPTPSGAATTCLNAVRLYSMTGETGYLDWVRGALPQFWALADLAPTHAGTALEAIMAYFDAAAPPAEEG